MTGYCLSARMIASAFSKVRGLPALIMKLKSSVTIRLILIVILTMSSAGIVRASAPDVRFASGKSSLRIPFRLHNNLIYLQLSVNNSQPLWFILDTGASHIINTRRAQALGLQLRAAEQTIGAGETYVDVSTADGITFRLPGVTLSDQTVAALSLEGVEECTNRITADSQGGIVQHRQSASGIERQAIDGVLGHQFFKRFVVEIDYAGQRMNLYEPGSYKYSGKGEIIPLDVEQSHVYVHSQITPLGRDPFNGAVHD